MLVISSQRGLQVPIYEISLTNCHNPGIAAYQIRLPKAFTGTKQLVAGSAADDEVLGEVDAPNAIEPADERLACRAVDSRYDWTDEVWTKSLLVQARRHQVCECLWRDVAFLP